VTSSIAVNLFAAVLVALLLGYAAQRLRLPVLAGYLLAGVLVGPFTPGFRSDPEVVRGLAEIGVAFLMFAVGASVNLRGLRRVQRFGLIGGVLQVALTAVLGALVARTLGASWVSGLFFGALIAPSSTVVAVRILSERGQIDALYARIAIGILLVQDLLVIPMVLVLPALSAPSGPVLQPFLIALGKAVLVLGLSFVAGTRIMPKLLDRVAETGSRELMLFATISIALGAALGSQAIGLSPAIGAFAGGLVLSESHLSRQVTGAFAPLRDLFSIFFFISVGMLLDLGVIADHPWQTIVVLLVVVAGKGAIVTGLGRIFGYPTRVSFMVGVTLAQVGEFSFILAGVGLGAGVIGQDLYSVVISSALVSIFLSPFLMGLGDRLLHHPVMTSARPAAVVAQDGHAPQPALRDHAIVAGYGRVGRELVEALQDQGIPVVVIEQDPAAVRVLAARGIRYVFGDVSMADILSEAGTNHARLLALTMPDASAVRAAARNATRLNQGITMVARVRYTEEMAGLRGERPVWFVHPEFEAGLHFTRHALAVYGLDTEEANERLEARRARHYEG
jgi:CPA2 family monovalent cation:H+ antiporter-2